MNFNRTLTSAVTALALVAAGGLAYAQTSAPSGTMPGAPGETNKQGAAQMKIPTAPAAKAQPQVQAQPAASTGATMGTTTTMQADTTPPVQRTTVARKPRADRN
ncbi:hypothetical protein [Polaromonas sp.]|uniref:hypothetical protein n=1 Tax=Polaromonas sp. TaxID=1869339 RepID=UPI00248930AE|nr:hypothetical protein [Polaromonas sp.]MDI1274227.1 hypothetical protein [Polaromonas sp.]